MAAELPNTDDATVMRMAVAWEIVLRANYPTASGQKPDDILKTLTEAYTKTYSALLANEEPHKGSNIQFKQ